MAKRPHLRLVRDDEPELDNKQRVDDEHIKVSDVLAAEGTSLADMFRRAIKEVEAERSEKITNNNQISEYIRLVKQAKNWRQLRRVVEILGKENFIQTDDNGELPKNNKGNISYHRIKCVQVNSKKLQEDLNELEAAIKEQVSIISARKR